MKRILALVLCLCLLIPVLPVAAAREETESARICQEMADHYYTILKRTGRRSLSGYCGLAASWQLYLLGVNDWVDGHHGKDQFDAYCNLAVTSGGHSVESYSFRYYTLTEALNALCKNGARDVYNILVGFQQTETALGSIYGHSMVIYAILDGMVYFCESYDTPFGKAGTPLKLSIGKFAAYYDGRGAFEGLIHFGKKGYAANCQEYPSNLFLEVSADTVLYTQPCLPGTEDSALLRQVTRGERVWANGLVENPDGVFYYRVDDSGEAGYLPAEDAQPFSFVYEDIAIAEGVFPEELEIGEDFPIAGRIWAEYGDITGVYLSVTDRNGAEALNTAISKQNGVYDLELDIFSRMLDFGSLTGGVYTYHITAYSQNAWLEQGRVRYDKQALQLVEAPFLVGEGALPRPEPQPEPARDGWFRENGTWYCYEQGEPRTGWYCDGGGDYYLKEDGSVTTGWAIINGQPRYFSRTGSMRTGWLDTPDGRMYLLFNGVPATGKRIIDGKEYVFRADGVLTEG